MILSVFFRREISPPNNNKFKWPAGCFPHFLSQRRQFPPPPLNYISRKNLAWWYCCECVDCVAVSLTHHSFWSGSGWLSKALALCLCWSKSWSGWPSKVIQYPNTPWARRGYQEYDVRGQHTLHWSLQCTVKTWINKDTVLAQVRRFVLHVRLSQESKGGRVECGGCSHFGVQEWLFHHQEESE